jgi:8-oxo-dGTP diphosphatase
MNAEKICTIYFARPVLRMGPPTEAGHTAVWTDPKSALDLLDNQGDRAMLCKAFGYRSPR